MSIHCCPDEPTSTTDLPPPSHSTPLNLLSIPTVDTKLRLAAMHHTRGITLLRQLSHGHGRVREILNGSDQRYDMEKLDIRQDECKAIRNAADVLVELEAYHEALDMYQQVIDRMDPVVQNLRVGTKWISVLNGE